MKHQHETNEDQTSPEVLAQLAQLRALAEQQLTPPQLRGLIQMTQVSELTGVSVADANQQLKAACLNIRNTIGSPSGFHTFYGGAIQSPEGVKLITYGVYTDLESLLAAQAEVLPLVKDFPQPDVVTFVALAEVVTLSNWYETRW